MSIRVTVEDLETGDTETKVIPAGDYLLVCAEPCELAHVNAYRTGTHVLTVKGHRKATKICTGITATWCPVHGDCRCPNDGPEQTPTLDDWNCPLHAPSGLHAAMNAEVAR